MNWVFSLALATCVTANPGTYYNSLSPRTFKLISKEENSAFGFSVSYVKKLKRLVVGAPLANDIGDVYTCDLTNKENNFCGRVQENNVVRYLNTKYSHTKYWLGASVKGTDDSFVACAPLTTVKSSADPKGIGSQGRCYKYDEPENELHMFTSLLSNNQKNLTSVKKNIKIEHFEQTMDSLGWSIDIVDSGHIAIGGAAVISGRVIYRSSFTTGTSELMVGSDSKISYNFGYSLVSGKFGSRSIDIAVGSPFGTYGYGSVSLFTKELNLLNMKIPNGSKVGSMYGAVLCVATLAKTPWSDLLVGSPTYAENNAYDVGAVFVYITQKKSVKLQRLLVGRQDGSMFGSAIVSVGDQNGDGIDEIAISAPYEDSGHGAVYLYSGTHIMSSEKNINPVQKLEPLLPYKAFGYSLAALDDYDENGCKELAIGAPYNNTVVVINCFASITIKLMYFQKSLIPRKIQNISACFRATFPSKPVDIDAKINVAIKIAHPVAKLNDPAAGMFTVALDRRKTKYCENIDINLLEEGNYAEDIYYTISAQLDGDEQSRKFKLADNSDTVISGSMRGSECGETHCVPDLKYIGIEFSGAVKKRPERGQYIFLTGSSDVINASVLVENKGQVAYDACAHISVKGVPGLSYSTECKPLNATVLECRPKHLLRKTNPPWKTENISFNMASLNNKNKEITFVVTIYEWCDVLGKDMIFTENITLISDSNNVIVSGLSGQISQSPHYEVVNFTRSDIATNKAFEHVYMIVNNGGMNWVDINIIVVTDNHDFITRHVEVYENETQTCAVTSKTNKQVCHSCVIHKLNKHAAIKVKVMMQVVSDKLSDRIAKEKLTVYSEILVDLENTRKSSSISSELRLIDASVPWWIIAVSCIFALIILLILILIFAKFGFLKRKNRENLEQAKIKVKRQSMMRRSMTWERLHLVGKGDKRKYRQSVLNVNGSTIPYRSEIGFDPPKATAYCGVDNTDPDFQNLIKYSVLKACVSYSYCVRQSTLIEKQQSAGEDSVEGDIEPSTSYEHRKSQTKTIR